MRYGLVVIAALLFTVGITTCGYADALAFYTPPIVSAPLVSKAPNMDGLLEPNEWAAAGTMSRFISLGGRSEPVGQTEMWVGYDAHNLYVGAILHDPEPSAIKAEVTERDGPVYQDDCLELFFDPANTGESYIHFIVNPAGVRYDAFVQSADVDYRWEVHAAMLESGWSVEMALPFEGDIPPSTGSIWRFLAARYVPHLNERSCSSRLLAGFHEPENFGQIIFAQAPAVMKLASLGNCVLGDNSAVTVVTNLGSEVFTGKVNVRVMAPTKYGNDYGAEKVTLEPGKRALVRVAYKLSQGGLNTVQFSLTDARGASISRTVPYPIELPTTDAELVELEKSLAAALRVWSALDDSAYKVQAGEQIDAVIERWMEVSKRYREGRKTMTSGQLTDLQSEISELTSWAELIKLKLESYMQTHADAGLVIEPASALARVDLATGADRQFAVAYTEAARNSRTALQMVVSPFPGARPGG